MSFHIESLEWFIVNSIKRLEHNIMVLKRCESEMLDFSIECMKSKIEILEVLTEQIKRIKEIKE